MPKIGPKKQSINVFDKSTDAVFTPNIKNIASERGFYDFYIGEEGHSLEPALSELEDRTRSAIVKITTIEALTSLTDEDRQWIAMFVAMQFLRVKKQQEILKELTRGIVGRVRAMGFDTQRIEDIQEMDDDNAKMAMLRALLNDSPVFAEMILKKIWILFKFPADDPLYISDHPVVMHNDESFGPYGNIGFAVPMIQIYLPISSTLALAFWCPTIEQKFRNSVAEIEKHEQQVRVSMTLKPGVDLEKTEFLLRACQQEKDKPLDFIRKVNSGCAILQTTEQVTFLNSLQVMWSHRFVMCAKNDFSLVQRMIEDNEKYRTGINITLD